MDIYPTRGCLEILTNMPLVRLGDDDRSIARPRKNTAQSLRRSRTASCAGSPCWSARPRSKNLSNSPICSARPAGSARLLRSTRSPRFTRAMRRHQDQGLRHPQRPLSRTGSLHRRASRRTGRITIATNMAGRGTDIQLGGNADMRIRQEITDITDPASAKKARAPTNSQAGRAAEGKGARRRWALCARHRAARKPPHR